MKALSQEEFLEKAKIVHPEYDYSNVKYYNNKTKVNVICSIHGDFSIRPDCLLRGTGCPKCGGTYKMSNDEFIQKANYVHNNYFTYDKCQFNGTGEKVIVTCPIHGDFKVKANNHLNGCNCKQCDKNGIAHEINKLPKINASTRKLTTEEFIERAKAKWGNKYSYEHVVYEKSDKHVLVTCPIHGDFHVTPNHFLNKRGCPKCGKNYRYSTDEFIDRLKKINGDRYTYDKTKYKTIHESVTITCPIHGDFVNQPSNLLKGQGCPSCQESILEKNMFELLKNNNIRFETQKHFKWLGKQSLDFFLPEYNIAIECQGIQHFEDIPFFSSINFNERIKLDCKKLKLCEQNNVKILYYTNIKKYIDNKSIFDIDELYKHLKNLIKCKDND